MEGLSAYDIWLSQGNYGSEEDYLATLKGERGPPGPRGPEGKAGKDSLLSAESGHEVSIGDVMGRAIEGTVRNHVDSLRETLKGKDGKDGQSIKGDKGDRGEKGEQGPQGKDGKHGANGINGKDGRDGAKGDKGDPGQDGKHGKSAYELWLDDGNKGSEEDYHQSVAKAAAYWGGVIIGGRGSSGISNITGLITAGTNVTITGSGTAASPYNISSSGGGGSPGGSNTQVQFNDSGTFGGDAQFTYDKTNDVLNLRAINAIGTASYVPPNGAGVKMFWYPANVAFRAGQVTGSQWDGANIGTASVAFGLNTTAAGISSTVTGFGNTASSSATYSFLSGYNSTTAAPYSALFGQNHTADIASKNVTITGTNCGAINSPGAFLTGIICNANNGGYSLVSGSFNGAQNVGNLIGGFFNFSDASNCLLAGDSNYADPTATSSVLAGTNNQAFNSYAVALGNANIINGQSGVALGENNTAYSYAEVVVGSYNTSYTPASTTSWNAADRAFTVGIGQSGSPADGMVMLKSGKTGVGTSSPTSRLHSYDTSASHPSGFDANFKAEGNAPSMYLKGPTYGAFWGISSSIITIGFNASNGVIFTGLSIDTISGNVATPYSFSVGGNINLPTTSSTAGIINVNSSRFIHSYGTDNTFIGKNSGNFTLSSAESNVGIGVRALDALTTGTYNVAIGTDAMGATTTGYNSIAIGYGALASNTTGYQNFALGVSALAANTTGINNLAFGENALVGNINGGYNVALGRASLQGNTTGSYNSAFGYTALYTNTTGDYNCSFGLQAGFGNTTGAYNNSFGTMSLLGTTTGTGNSAIGYTAGQTNTTGNYNSYLGYEADATGNNYSRSTAIGYQAKVTASDQVMLGKSTATVVVGGKYAEITGSNREGNLLFAGYSSVGSLPSGAGFFMGTSLRASSTANSLEKTSSDDAHFFYTRYDRGLEFHTGITGAAGTVFSDTTNMRMLIDPNGGVVINGGSVNASAQLQIDSTTQGFLPPRMTTTQKNAISSPAEGLIVYDITTKKHYGYDGTTWNAFY